MSRHERSTVSIINLLVSESSHDALPRGTPISCGQSWVSVLMQVWLHHNEHSPWKRGRSNLSQTIAVTLVGIFHESSDGCCRSFLRKFAPSALSRSCVAILRRRSGSASQRASILRCAALEMTYYFIRSWPGNDWTITPLLVGALAKTAIAQWCEDRDDPSQSILTKQVLTVVFKIVG